jgi:hypothetical protein
MIRSAANRQLSHMSYIAGYQFPVEDASRMIFFVQDPPTRRPGINHCAFPCPKQLLLAVQTAGQVPIEASAPEQLEAAHP